MGSIINPPSISSSSSSSTSMIGSSSSSKGVHTPRRTSDIERVMHAPIRGSNISSSSKLTLSPDCEPDWARRQELGVPASVKLARRDIEELEYTDLRLGPLNRNASGDTTSKLGNDSYVDPGILIALELAPGVPVWGRSPDGWLKIDANTRWKATRGLECRKDESLCLRYSGPATG